MISHPTRKCPQFHGFATTRFDRPSSAAEISFLRSVDILLPMITRRELLATSLLPLAFAQQKPFRSFGGAPAGFPIRTRAAREAHRPFDFLDYCHSLGFA